MEFKMTGFCSNFQERFLSICGSCPNCNTIGNLQNLTVLPRIVLHAPIYETEAMVDAPKVSPKCTFFLPHKNRAVSYITACHCRDLKISLPIRYKNGQINA